MLLAMPPSHRPPSPEVTALRAAAEGICGQLLGHARRQARLIRSGAAGELTEADIERMAEDIARCRACAARRGCEAVPEPVG
jgi:hypothetical protein